MLLLERHRGPGRCWASQARTRPRMCLNFVPDRTGANPPWQHRPGPVSRRACPAPARSRQHQAPEEGGLRRRRAANGVRLHDQTTIGIGTSPPGHEGKLVWARRVGRRWGTRHGVGDIVLTVFARTLGWLRSASRTWKRLSNWTLSNPEPWAGALHVGAGTCGRQKADRRGRRGLLRDGQPLPPRAEVVADPRPKRTDGGRAIHARG